MFLRAVAPMAGKTGQIVRKLIFPLMLFSGAGGGHAIVQTIATKNQDSMPQVG
jgi:hypothetical protein